MYNECGLQEEKSEHLWSRDEWFGPRAEKDQGHTALWVCFSFLFSPQVRKSGVVLPEIKCFSLIHSPELQRCVLLKNPCLCVCVCVCVSVRVGEYVKRYSMEISALSSASQTAHAFSMLNKLNVEYSQTLVWPNTHQGLNKTTYFLQQCMVICINIGNRRSEGFPSEDCIAI